MKNTIKKYIIILFFTSLKSYSYSLWSNIFFCYSNCNVNDSISSIITPSKLEDHEDSIKNINDTLVKDTTNIINKEPIDTEIKYRAKDTIKIDNINKTTFLYNEAEVEYGDIKLKSGKIFVDNAKNIIKAYGIPDSTGKLTQLPVFEEKGKTYYTNEIVYNMKTEQALIKKIKTKEQEGYVGGQKTKKVDDKILFAEDFYFSTDDNLLAWMENPKDVDVDFFINSNKVKMITNDKIMVSESLLYLSEIPTPLVIPSAFFPLNNERSSGIIIPTYTDTQDQGFGLTGGGYYFVINKNFDLLTNIDFYTKGSWNIKNTLSYKKRYNYSGRFFFSYENVIRGEQGFSNYNQSILYNIQWSHTQDPKANPLMNFSASVNMSSGKYYTNSLDFIGNSAIATASANSSINFNKRFEEAPFNISSSISHSQNFQTRQANMSLPNVNISMNRIFPFKGKTNNWYERIGISLNTSVTNNISIHDSLMFKKQMFDDMKTSINHSIPISTSFNVFKYFSLSPSINYTEKWFINVLEKSYDKENDSIIVKKKNKFDSYREFSTGLSLGTTIYGMFDFGESKIKAIRHVVKPNISFNYKPDFGEDFWGYYDKLYTDSYLGGVYEYSRFEHISSPSRGASGIVSMSVSNTLEAKVKNDEYKEEKDKYRKISLIDQLSISTGYNMLLNEFKWSTINVNMGFRLIKDRLRINYTTSFDLYSLDEHKQRVNKFYWDTDRGLARYLGSNMNVSFSISDNDFKQEKKDQKKDEDKDSEFDKYGYFNINIPWDLSFSYNLTHNNNIGQNQFSNSIVNITGNVSPTKTLKMGFSTGYDFKLKKVSFTSLNFSKDLNTFYFTFNWTPMGQYRNYSFFIGIKASILRDLKYEKREFNLEQRI